MVAVSPDFKTASPFATQTELNVITTGLVTSVLVGLNTFTDSVVVPPGDSDAPPMPTASSPSANSLPVPFPKKVGVVVSTEPELTLLDAPLDIGVGSSGELEPPPHADNIRLINTALTIFVVFRVCMASSWLPTVDDDKPRRLVLNSMI